MRQAIRGGSFSKESINVAPATTIAEPLGQTFVALTVLYKAKDVYAQQLKTANTIYYRLKPLLDFFGNRRV